MSAGADSLKSILFALGANFLIAVAKTAGAVFTGSWRLAWVVEVLARPLRWVRVRP